MSAPAEVLAEPQTCTGTAEEQETDGWAPKVSRWATFGDNFVSKIVQRLD